MKHTTTDESRVLQLLRAGKYLSGDLIAVFALVLAVNGAALLGASPALTFVLGLPLLLFAPGYVLALALFPRAADAPDARIDGVERAALAFGLSVALVPLFGIALWAVGAGFAPAAVRGGVSAFVVTVALLGIVRQLRVPTEAQFGVSARRTARRFYESTVGTGGLDGVLNLLVVVSVLVAMSGLTFALAAPQDGEQYTGFVLLSENEDGKLVASGYPSELSVGESAELTAAVENREGTDVEYTVVAELQRVRTDDGEVTVLESEELERTTIAVGDGETERWAHEVTPSIRGENLRLTYTLYEGEAPDDATTDSAYRHTYVWVNVSA